MARWLPWVFQVLFWFPFIVRGRVDAWSGRGPKGPVVHAHARPGFLILLHSVALGLSYFGLGLGVATGQADTFGFRALAGALTCQSGAALASWTLRTFRSWRLRAELTADHELSTGGPFRWVRHPIYAAMNLLSLGTAIWVPNAWTWTGFVAMCLTSDVRARAEEPLLVAAFGERYRAYMATTKRFVPWVY